ncbi:MAG: terminase gpA endonuclease subunit [Treponemataceae bacterium]
MEKKLVDDIDFLIEQFFLIKDNNNYEMPSDFAERVRVLKGDLTPFPGPFSFERFLHFKEILDCFHPLNDVQQVSVMKGNQQGFTTAVLENILLYNIMVEPKAQMYITATAGLMKTSVNTKIERMIDDAGARPLIFAQSKKSKSSKDSGDTIEAKSYKGGYLHMFGGKSPARLRSMSYRAAICDELDAYDQALKDEGSVIELIKNRTDAYAKSKKIFFGSTPLIMQRSHIWKLYLDGDQRKYFIPCKHCGKRQDLVWHGTLESGERYGIVWENDENFKPKLETVFYKCKFCGGLMKNFDKAALMKKGEWRATVENNNPKIRSYHTSVLYNPPGMFSWEDMVQNFSECWDFQHNRMKDKEKYRIFRNTKQGLPFEETGLQIRYEKSMLFRRFGFIRGTIPNDLAATDTKSEILVVLASVDVQKNCLFVDVKGYSADCCVWTLDFFSIDGDTETFGGVWDTLHDFLLEKTYKDKDGKEYAITLSLIDSGRYTDYIYAYCKRNSSAYPCKGMDYIRGGETFKRFQRSTEDTIGKKAFHINTTKLKDRISNSLNFTSWKEGNPQPHWYFNFPDDFKDDYFKQFESEVKKDEYDRKTNQYIRTIWKAKHGAPNHAFDTFVYNLAALEILASSICLQFCDSKSLNWDWFWEYLKENPFVMTE